MSMINHHFPEMEVSRGSISGAVRVHKFGYNPDIDTGTDPEDVWDYGTLYPFLAAAATLYASSSSGSDTFEFTVQGLDADWNEQEAVVTLTGQDQVALPGTWIRVNRCFNDTGTAAVGDVYIAEQSLGGDLVGGVPQTATKVKAKVGVGNEQTLMCVYSVPAGKTLFLYHWYLSVMGLGGGTWLSGNSALDAGLFVRNFGKVFRIKERVGVINKGDTIFDHHYQFPELIPQKSDVVIRVIATTTDDAQVSAEFEGILIDSVETSP